MDPNTDNTADPATKTQDLQTFFNGLLNTVTASAGQYVLDNTGTGQDIKTQVVANAENTTILNVAKSPTTWVIAGIAILGLFLLLRK
jgi:hypothetical protein